MIRQELNKHKVRRTERGWAGHYICANDCLFRRNTLLEYEDKKWVISTVGCMRARVTVEPYQKAGDIVEIGFERWYETMAFEASEYSPYDDIDVEKKIHFESEWGIWGKSWEEVMSKYKYPDLAANEMHEAVVEELAEKIKN